MDLLWAIIVILVIFFVLFVVLPALLASPKPTTPSTVAPTTQITNIRPSPVRPYQQVPTSKVMLDAQYIQARDTVPEDHPRKPIGSCPYSKPQSIDLPLPNVPMCVAVQQDNMRLHT